LARGMLHSNSLDTSHIISGNSPEPSIHLSSHRHTLSVSWSFKCPHY
jgi:hypothetical protein